MTMETITNSTTPAVEYVQYLLTSLEKHQSVNAESAKRAVDTARAVFDDSTIYPSASAEGDIVTLHWTGGDRSIDLSFGPGTDFSVKIGGTRNETLTVDSLDSIPLRFIRNEIASFTSYVNGEES